MVLAALRNTNLANLRYRPPYMAVGGHGSRKPSAPMGVVKVVAMDDGFAPSGDHWIYYVEAGSGEPVLFIHAGVADSRMWLPQMEDVPKGFRFIAYDQRGFGRTKVGTESGRPLGDVISLLDYFSIDRAVLVGCSIGAGIALDVAIEHTERVRGLVLVGANSPGFEPANGYYESPQWPEAVAAFKAGDFQRVAELDYEMWMVGYGRERVDVTDDLRPLFIEMDLTALESEQKREELAVEGPDRAAALRGIEQPTLSVVGMYDLPDIQAAAHDLAAKLSGRPASVIPNSAHLPSLQNPTDFNAVLGEFLGSL